MKRRSNIRLKNWCKLKSKFEKIAIGLQLNTKRIVMAVVLLTFILPINKQVFADKEIKPGKRQATLILSDGTKIILNTCSDTIVNSETKGVHIKIDSCGINYITPASKKKLDQSKNKLIKKNNLK